VKNSLNKTARWSTLALAMGIMSAISVQGLAAINWPGGDNNDTEKKSKDYNRGYKTAQEDCVSAPKDCKVLLEDVVANPGWGETEPNDHRTAADRIFLNRFYKGNTLDKFDQDWYYLGATSPNQNLVINFLGDQANYTDTAGWLVKVHDRFGNVIATFDTETTGTGNVYRNGDKPEDIVDPGEPLLAKTPLSNAHIMLTTLSFPGRYYISVESREDAGAERAYHIAAMISPSDQMSPNPDSNFHDAETEPNDLQEDADPLNSNVHMFGTFGRRWVSWFTPAQPPEYELKYFYRSCDPMVVSTMPVGLDNCECDITSVDNNGDIDPPNPNVTDQTPAGACEARNELVPGTGTNQGSWNYAYDYDNDWFKYRSDGNEQLHFELCTKGNCDFTRVHVRIIYVNDAVVLLDGPVLPGSSLDIGAASPGVYYIELSPEPVDGPRVDPDSGVHTVDDLTGPYNFLLRSTKLPAHGG
jgi:hypothetical protein